VLLAVDDHVVECPVTDTNRLAMHLEELWDALTSELSKFD
jgi:hypothetical protein